TRWIEGVVHFEIEQSELQFAIHCNAKRVEQVAKQSFGRAFRFIVEPAYSITADVTALESLAGAAYRSGAKQAGSVKTKRALAQGCCRCRVDKSRCNCVAICRDRADNAGSRVISNLHPVMIVAGIQDHWTSNAHRHHRRRRLSRNSPRAQAAGARFTH